MSSWIWSVGLGIHINDVGTHPQNLQTSSSDESETCAQKYSPIKQVHCHTLTEHTLLENTLTHSQAPVLSFCIWTTWRNENKSANSSRGQNGDGSDEKETAKNRNGIMTWGKARRRIRASCYFLSSRSEFRTLTFFSEFWPFFWIFLQNKSFFSEFKCCSFQNSDFFNHLSQNFKKCS